MFSYTLKVCLFFILTYWSWRWDKIFNQGTVFHCNPCQFMQHPTHTDLLIPVMGLFTVCFDWWGYLLTKWTPILINMQSQQRWVGSVSLSGPFSPFMTADGYEIVEEWKVSRKALRKLSVSHVFLCQVLSTRFWHWVAEPLRDPIISIFQHYVIILGVRGWGRVNCGCCWNNPNIYYQLLVCGELVLLIVGGSVGLSSRRKGNESWRRIKECAELQLIQMILNA